MQLALSKQEDLLLCERGCVEPQDRLFVGADVDAADSEPDVVLVGGDRGWLDELLVGSRENALPGDSARARIDTQESAEADRRIGGIDRDPHASGCGRESARRATEVEGGE